MARNLLDLQDMMHRIDGEWARWSPEDTSLIAMPIGHIGAENSPGRSAAKSWERPNRPQPRRGGRNPRLISDARGY